MRIPKFIQQNLLLKMTSLNAGVISIRLLVSLFIQRLLAQWVGEVGIAQIGSLRNLIQMLTSITSLGTFNGVIKYLAEYKEDKAQLQKLFSTTWVFVILGSIGSAIILYFGADFLSERLFYDNRLAYVIKFVAVMVPFIAVQRVFHGVVNGLSAYKNFAKIDLIAYLMTAVLMIFCLLQYNIDGALIAIALTPIIQIAVLLFIFLKVLREYVQFSKLRLKAPMAKSLLAFSAMSLFSTVLLNYVEIDVRSMIETKITQNDAGIWTAMTNISKNYMVFSTALFTLYVIPKFAAIKSSQGFKKELVSIYKTLLPLFGVGMILVYIFREFVVSLIYPGFEGLTELFKWQLLGDFIRLASLVIVHQFIAKKMVRTFIFSEAFSLAAFYILAYTLTDVYGLEGVVIAHLIRYIAVFLLVLFLVIRYYKRKQVDEEAARR
ncbi:O-antigen translocase [Altibacter sp. HG106]|uniref:O-antigen translocase n=1 Tax=Altibacter sp. HG106 TaxID=3023937 RepID=UPI002350ED49|nr:O-antigen translocase [Altibacter sp. HG106]MDC7996134.1 O-antigen translocase [Altibacter sp. HG106]